MDYFPIYWFASMIYPIIVLIAFVLLKYGLKIWFNYKKIILLSFIVATVSYIVFTFIPIWLPVYEATQNNSIWSYIFWEYIEFHIGAIICSVIVYTIGRHAYGTLHKRSISVNPSK